MQRVQDEIIGMIRGVNVQYDIHNGEPKMSGGQLDK